MSFPFALANGVGNFPDADKYMANYHYLFAMCKGNFLAGPGFETWTTATSFTNPADGATLSDGWTLQKGGTSSATADISREATTKDTGSYAMKVNITGAGSSDSYLRIKQSVSNSIRFSGQSIFLGVMVKVGTANKVRVSLYDGVNAVAYSSYHTGDNTWQKLTVALACSAALTELTVKIEITSDFTGAVYIDSSFLYAIQSTMSSTARAALEYFGPDDPLSLLISNLSVLGTLSVAGAITPTGGISAWDMWLNGGATWTYASASTFTVAGDQTAVFTKGTRLKFTQTTVKYAVVVASSHAAGTTTVTIAVNTDYTIANAAISSNYYSYAASPAGYPGWFNYTPTLTGGTADLSGYDYARFNIIGTTCFVKFYCASRTLSGSNGDIRVTLPVAGVLTTRILLDYHAYDATNGNRSAVLDHKPSDGYMTLWATVAFGNWTTSWINLELSVAIDYQI